MPVKRKVEVIDLLSSDQENLPPTAARELSNADVAQQLEQSKPLKRSRRVVDSSSENDALEVGQQPPLSTSRRIKQPKRGRPIVFSDIEDYNAEIVQPSPKTVFRYPTERPALACIQQHPSAPKPSPRRTKPSTTLLTRDDPPGSEHDDDELEIDSDEDLAIAYARIKQIKSTRSKSVKHSKSEENRVIPQGADSEDELPDFKPAHINSKAKLKDVQPADAPVDLLADSEDGLSDTEDSDDELSHDVDSDWDTANDDEGSDIDTASDEGLEITFQDTVGSSGSNTNKAVTAYIATLLWGFLIATPASLKNPIHSMLLTGMAMIASMMEEYSVCFAPGLLNVLQSKSPPTLAFFNNLPAAMKMIWAVYLIVLHKAGCRFKIYIGTGTNYDIGVTSRLKHYDDPNGVHLPRFVAKAIKDGYTVTRKGLLCWAPIPPPGKWFLGRVLFVALEALFSFVFWAMKSKTRDYGMPSVCPWSRAELAYDGLCSHSALYEMIRGESSELSLEQIAQKEKEMKETRRARRTAATMAWMRSVRDRDPEAFAVKKRAYTAPRIPLISARSKANKAKRIAAGVHRCVPCDKNFDSPGALKRHEGKQCYKDRKAGLPAKQVTSFKELRYYENTKKSKKFFCEPCQLACGSKTELRNHENTARHLKKAAAAKEAVAAAEGTATI